MLIEVVVAEPEGSCAGRLLRRLLPSYVVAKVVFGTVGVRDSLSKANEPAEVEAGNGVALDSVLDNEFEDLVIQDLVARV